MSVRYLVPCNCGRKHPVEATQAGQTLQCPCGQAVPVPTMQQLRALEQESHPEPLKGPPQTSLAQRLMLIGGVVLLAGAGLSAAVYWTRPQWLPYELLSPVESLAVWRLYTREPHIQLSPAEKEFRTLCRRNSRWLAVTLALTAIGAVTFATGLLVAGRRGRSRPPGSDHNRRST